MPPTHHALLIGINQYSKIPNARLQGAAGDAELMRSLLVDRFGFPAECTRTLRDGEATAAAIRGALAAIAAAVGEDDIVVLFYAGHGARMADPARPGRMIESIVPSDSGRGTEPNLDVPDEEIDRWVQAVNAKTPHVTLIFDCCHAGSATRDGFGEAVRQADLCAGPGAAKDGSFAGWLAGRRRVVAVAACRADEYANEHKAFTGDDVIRHGALTFFLAEALRQVPPGATWRDVFEQVAPALTSRYGRQHPQLEGRIDEVLFGTREIRPASYLEVHAVEPGTVVLAGGAAHGLRCGSLWTIRSSGSRSLDEGEEVAAVEIQAVRAATSTARVVAAGEPRRLVPGLRAFLRELQLPEPGLRLAIEAPAGPRARLAEALAGETLLRLMEKAEDAEVLIRHHEDAVWTAVGRDGRLAVRLRPDTRDEIPGLITDLLAVGRYRQLLGLDNPDTASPLRGRVSLRVLRWNPDQKALAEAVPEVGDGVIVFEEGEKAEFEIVNRHEAPLWVTLLEFGCDHRISLLLPFPRHATYARGGMRLEPGQTLRVAADYYRQDPRYAEAARDGLPLHLPQGFPWAAEPGEEAEMGLLVLKLLITSASTDFEFLEQAATRKDIAAGPHPLEQLAFLYAAGKGTRGFRPRAPQAAPETEWTTVTLPIGVRRTIRKNR
jgi:Caspase domain